MGHQELIQKVQFIVGDNGDENNRFKSHPIFAEMEILDRKSEELEWKETARWVKFEEDVEEGGNRWSKPHVATLSLHSLLILRSLLLNGTIVFDLNGTTLEEIVDQLLTLMVEEKSLAIEQKEKVKEILFLRHRHLYQLQKDKSSSKLQIIRSFADIGKNLSTTKLDSASSILEGKMIGTLSPFKKSNNGQFLSGPGTGVQEDTDVLRKSCSNVSIHRNQSFGQFHNQNNESSNQRSNKYFMKKIHPDSEASNILVGEVDFLNKALCAFVRLRESIIMNELTEVPIPTRFIFLLLCPQNSNIVYKEVGRSISTLMSDEIFHDVAYKKITKKNRAKTRKHLLTGIDEFLGSVTILPPGEWDPKIRIEPPENLPSQEERKQMFEKCKLEMLKDHTNSYDYEIPSELKRSGTIFGGLINDFKRKVTWYVSDFTDAFSIECVASWIFLYFACLSPIITFGGLLSQATEKSMAAMESLVSGFICGVVYGLFSGQPLTILGSTGPVLVFETIIFDFCSGQQWNYLSFRLWIGIWIAVILLFLVAFDASAFVCYITRFTEENFASLIAFIFIIKAVENLLAIGTMFPMKSSRIFKGINCSEFNLIDSELANIENLKFSNNVESLTNEVKPSNCKVLDFYPDVFLMSCILFFGTFVISTKLKAFRNSLFFSNKVRKVLSDFAVIIAIFSMSLLDYLMDVATPKLEVPKDFKPTLETRGWVIPFFKQNPLYSAVLAIVPAFLGTILIFMDQQITAVIVNRKENKLKKGSGYHLDLFVLSTLIFVCSLLGIPWFVAATVLSINHVNSLKLESECAAPGEKPKFLGVREQRVTHILIFLTIGLSVFLTPILTLIPMPVLYGVFLYMGVASLNGVQFFERILLFFMPNKYQPDYEFLRQVPVRRVHLFTLIQLTCLVCLWIIKSYRATSILFPLMLIFMIGVRKCLDYVFTKKELEILDDVMPSFRKESPRNTQLSKNNTNSDAADSSKEENSVKNSIVSINISDEVNSTDIWKRLNNSINLLNKRSDSTDSKATPTNDFSSNEKRYLASTTKLGQHQTVRVNDTYITKEKSSETFV